MCALMFRSCTPWHLSDLFINDHWYTSEHG